MDVYSYHPTTGEYLLISVADPDPLNDGEFLVPAHATSVKPPSTNANEMAVFVDGSWSVIADFRGQTVYSKADKSALKITELGDISDDYTLDEPGLFDEWNGSAWEVNLDLQIAHLKNQVKFLAGQKIIAIADVDKQRNMLARSIELERDERISGSLSADEQVEIDAMQSIWNRIKAIRGYSNSLEAALESDVNTDINAGWPE